MTDNFSNTSIARIGKGKPALPPLVDALKDSSEDVRIGVVVALGEIGRQEAIGPLNGLLGDSSEKVKKAAALALEKIEKLHRR